MFYEEQVRDGVLCYRSTPTGDWVPMSAERLTAMLLELRQRTAPAQMQPALHYTVMPQPAFIPAAPMWGPWQPPYTITCGDTTQNGVGTLTGAVR